MVAAREEGGLTMNDVAMIVGANERVEPESFMQPSRVRVFFQCRKCGHEFSRVYKATPVKDPKCPNRSCAEASELAQAKREIENLRRMLAEGKPPAQIGKNVTVKAVDATAEIVMEDYGLTNLRDNVREGENMAPKLPAPQQAAADSYFSPKKVGKAIGLDARKTALLQNAAINGAFRRMAVPPTAIAPKAKAGQPALVSVGMRSNDLYQGRQPGR